MEQLSLFPQEPPLPKRSLRQKQESKGKKWSSYQQHFFDWLDQGKRHAVLCAAAGSGKTTTLVECARRVQKQVLFCAFNRHIKEELSKRLHTYPQVTVKTLHGMGYATLRRAHPKMNLEPEDGRNKYRLLVANAWNEICQNGLGSTLFQNKEWDRKQEEVMGKLLNHVFLCTKEKEEGGRELNVAWTGKQLLDKARLTLTDVGNPENLAQLACRFDLVGDQQLWLFYSQILPQILKRGRQLEFGIDYTDLLWLTATGEYQPKQYDFVFVDECQDLNAAQRALVTKSLAPNGRLVAVGDPLQAIYAFAGADSDSFQQLRESFQAEEYPLSISYRCPKSHLRLAQKLNPQIEPAPWAEEGTIKHIPLTQLDEHVRRGDLIICRINAPLLSICLKLIQKGHAAKVRGRDIGKNLVALVEEVKKQFKPKYREFPSALSQWKVERFATIREQCDQKGQIASLIQQAEDRADSLRAVYEGARTRSFKGFKRQIQALFDENTPGIWLSSIHRAKGLEAERVFLLHPEIMPMSWAKGEQLQQEYNLIYIAYTRAKKELYFLSQTNA